MCEELFTHALLYERFLLYSAFFKSLGWLIGQLCNLFNRLRGNLWKHIRCVKMHMKYLFKFLFDLLKNKVKTASFTDLDDCYYFESILTTLEANYIFWGSRQNWLELKVEPPLSILACLNRWNTLYDQTVLIRLIWLDKQVNWLFIKNH